MGYFFKIPLQYKETNSSLYVSWLSSPRNDPETMAFFGHKAQPQPYLASGRSWVPLIQRVSTQATSSTMVSELWKRILVTTHSQRRLEDEQNIAKPLRKVMSNCENLPQGIVQRGISPFYCFSWGLNHQNMGFHGGFKQNMLISCCFTLRHPNSYRY